MVFWNKDKLFCDINPTCYAISMQKEICKRHIADALSSDKFAKDKSKTPLPNRVWAHCSNMIKRAKGVDITLQKNKAVNIDIASQKINGIVIHPGETFSFWKTVGKDSKRRGYMDGRVIRGDRLEPGTGGGLCNLGNTINLLVLHSPLEITEFHTHSDALAPDEHGRVPLSAGTSVSYNNIDFRAKNTTNQDIQILVWCDGDMLKAELRSDRDFPWKYEIVEEGHHFAKEGDKYYRISKIYRQTIDKKTDQILKKELIWDNHSEVMFDYDLIPKDLIWEETPA